MVTQGYYHEAVIIIEQPKRRLFVLSEPDNRKHALNDRGIRIYILRFKSS